MYHVNPQLTPNIGRKDGTKIVIAGKLTLGVVVGGTQSPSAIDTQNRPKKICNGGKTILWLSSTPRLAWNVLAKVQWVALNLTGILPSRRTLLVLVVKSTALYASPIWGDTALQLTKKRDTRKTVCGSWRSSWAEHIHIWHSIVSTEVFLGQIKKVRLSSGQKVFATLGQ